MVESVDAHLRESETSAEQPLTAVDLGLDPSPKLAADSKPDQPELPLDPAADTALQDGATVVPFTGVESEVCRQAAGDYARTRRALYDEAHFCVQVDAKVVFRKCNWHLVCSCAACMQPCSTMQHLMNSTAACAGATLLLPGHHMLPGPCQSCLCSPGAAAGPALHRDHLLHWRRRDLLAQHTSSMLAAALMARSLRLCSHCRALLYRRVSSCSVGVALPVASAC